MNPLIRVAKTGKFNDKKLSVNERVLTALLSIAESQERLANAIEAIEGKMHKS